MPRQYQKRGRNAAIGGLCTDMTPMIDVVFNLIIFFMVITDLSQRELEFLVLPPSETSITDDDDPDRLIVNIVDPDLPAMRGRVDPDRPPVFYRGSQVTDLEDLRRRLRLAADPVLHPDTTDEAGNPIRPVGFLAWTIHEGGSGNSTSADAGSNSHGIRRAWNRPAGDILFAPAGARIGGIRVQCVNKTTHERGSRRFWRRMGRTGGPPS